MLDSQLSSPQTDPSAVNSSEVPSIEPLSSSSLPHHNNLSPLKNLALLIKQHARLCLILGLTFFLFMALFVFFNSRMSHSTPTQTKLQPTPTKTSQPTISPGSATPTSEPTLTPTPITPKPTAKPTAIPTPKPTVAPSPAPSATTAPVPTNTPTPTPKDTTPPVISSLSGPADGQTYDFEGYCFPMYITDNVDKTPGLVQTRYKQDSADWSTWAPEYAPCYTNVPKGVHQFSLQVRDSSGNETAIVTRTFTLE